jgi:hypothetical protein
VVKVLFGVAYGWIHLHLYQSDTAVAHQNGLEAWALLKADPRHFVTSLLEDDYGGGTLLDSQHSYFKHLEYNLFSRLLAVFDVFTGGRYYVNIVWFCFLVFPAHVYLFRFFRRLFPHAARLLALLICFFPPVLFWVSGVHKDGLVFLGLCGVLYFFQAWLHTPRFGHALRLLLCLVLLFLFKNYLVLVLAPVLSAWWLMERYPARRRIIAMLSVAVCLLAFVASAWLPGSLNLPLQFARRQNDFLLLQANSVLTNQPLQPTLPGYLSFLPQALNHALLRPFFTDGRSLLTLVSAMELLLVNALLVGLVISRQLDARRLRQTAVVCLCGFISLNYLIIGYTIPFAGAIVRYRAPFELLLLCVLAGCTKDAFRERLPFKKEKRSSL